MKKLQFILILLLLIVPVKSAFAQLNYGMCSMMLPSEVSFQMSNIKGVPIREECNIYYKNTRKPKVKLSVSTPQKVENHQPIQKPSVNLELDFGKGNFVYQDT